jgi:polygalacturonase
MGTNMLFENNVVFNQDDCLAIISPTKNLHFRNSRCNGGHGLSIVGSSLTGDYADIRDIVYVIYILVGSGPLTSCLQDRKC